MHNNKPIADKKKTDPTKSVRCVRDWRDFSLTHYRLRRSGNQWKRHAEKLRQLAEYLATFADGDGSNIKVSIERMADKFEVDNATIYRWLDNLRELKAISVKQGLSDRYGTAVRSMTRDAFIARYEADEEAEIASYYASAIQKPATAGESKTSQTLGSRPRKLSGQDLANPVQDLVNPP